MFRIEQVTMRTIFLILLFISLILYPGCEPGGELIVINNMSEELKIMEFNILPTGEEFGPTILGNVPAKTQKEVGVIIYTYLDRKYRIEARNMSDEIVFSKDYIARELIKMKWTITIPAE